RAATAPPADRLAPRRPPRPAATRGARPCTSRRPAPARRPATRPSAGPAPIPDRHAWAAARDRAAPPGPTAPRGCASAARPRPGLRRAPARWHPARAARIHPGSGTPGWRPRRALRPAWPAASGAWRAGESGRRRVRAGPVPAPARATRPTAVPRAHPARSSGTGGNRTVHSSQRPPPRALDPLRIPGKRRAQAPWIRTDAHATEVEPVGIPARLHQGVRIDVAIAVALAGLLEQRQRIRVQGDHALAPQPVGVLRRARPVFGIVVVIAALRVVHQSEQGRHAFVQTESAGQRDTVEAHARPVRRTVDAVPVEAELLPQMRHQPKPAHSCPPVPT